MLDNRVVARLAMWSIFVASLVTAIKFVAWWTTGSVALYSDALESIVNIVASVFAWITIHYSHKPADANHQFGHHKLEYFSALAEGVLIILAAVMIFHEAWTVIGTDHVVEAPATGMMINAVATAINLFWALLLIRNGTRERSPALVADGRHILTDVYTSSGIMIGLTVAVLSGYVILDALIAMAVGANVMREGIMLVYSSYSGLMDRASDSEEAELIRTTIMENAKGAIEVHDIKTRVAGPVTFIEFHMVVDGSMTVSDSHEICDRIETALQKAIKGARTTIHVEPDHHIEPETGMVIG